MTASVSAPKSLAHDLAPPLQNTELMITGMACAACVRRIEKAVRAVPGVNEATVNLVTQRASVRFDPSTAQRDALVAAVEKAGYGVVEPQPMSSATSSAESRADVLAEAEAREQRTTRRDFTISAILTVPLLVIGMSHGAIPGFAGPIGHWTQLLLATPIVLGPGLRFLRLAWTALRHRSADMNTLVAIGVLSAWGYSTYILVSSVTDPHAYHHGGPHLYFEAAAAIVSFVLLGKLLETRARKRLSDAVRGLVALVPKTARRIGSDGSETDVDVAALRVGHRVLVPRRAHSDRRQGLPWRVGRRRIDAHRRESARRQG